MESSDIMEFYSEKYTTVVRANCVSDIVPVTKTARTPRANAQIRSFFPVPRRYVLPSFSSPCFWMKSNYIANHELTKFRDPQRIGNIRARRKPLRGHYRASGMVKAVRTMYREKPRYVHLNVKRTSIGKCYYVKNSARQFSSMGRAVEGAARSFSHAFCPSRARIGEYAKVPFTLLNLTSAVKINAHDFLSAWNSYLQFPRAL